MSYPPPRRTVPPIRNATNTATKRTTAVVLTAGSRTVPGTVKRSLLTIRSAMRTITTSTTVVIYATVTTSATIRTGSIRTACTS